MEGRGGDHVTMSELGPVTITRTLLGGPGTGKERGRRGHERAHEMKEKLSSMIDEINKKRSE